MAACSNIHSALKEDIKANLEAGIFQVAKTFFLDLQTLLDYLSLHGGSCLLSTTLANHAGTGSIMVYAGSIVSCSVYGASGNILLTGKPAQDALAHCSEWLVQFEDELPPTPAQPSSPFSNSPAPPGRQAPIQKPNLPEQSPVSPTTPAPSQQFPFPPAPSFEPHISIRRKRELTDHQLARLTSKQRMQLRMVLALINGERSAEEIKAQIHLTPETVDQIFLYLLTLDIID